MRFDSLFYLLSIYHIKKFIENFFIIKLCPFKMKACHFLMPTDWFEEMIRNWLQLVCTSFIIKWVQMSYQTDGTKVIL